MTEIPTTTPGKYPKWKEISHLMTESEEVNIVFVGFDNLSINNPEALMDYPSELLNVFEGRIPEGYTFVVPDSFRLDPNHKYERSFSLKDTESEDVFTIGGLLVTRDNDGAITLSPPQEQLYVDALGSEQGAIIGTIYYDQQGQEHTMVSRSPLGDYLSNPEIESLEPDMLENPANPIHSNLQGKIEKTVLVRQLFKDSDVVLPEYVAWGGYREKPGIDFLIDRMPRLITPIDLARIGKKINA